uniref:Uncharacterized protein n=1 Tax=Setaria italica TaxID=4555 RepID=A0A0Q3RFC9_SETIT
MTAGCGGELPHGPAASQRQAAQAVVSGFSAPWIFGGIFHKKPARPRRVRER